VGAEGHEGSWQQFDVEVERDVMAPLRDGVRLATDVYRPALRGQMVSGPFPAILERTPYNKQRLVCVAMAKYMARRGYVVAVQDVRGRYGSEGTFYGFAHEAPDGYDAVEWVAAQPWCNGKVGTIGLSYTASDQHALATLRPPHLAAMFVSEGMFNYHTCSMRHGGALELRFLVWAYDMALTSPRARSDRTLRAALTQARARIGDWLRQAPTKAGLSPLAALPEYEQWTLDLFTHGDYDEFWRQRGLTIEPYLAEHADVPVYLLGGWYDSYTRATLDSFCALSTSKRGPIKVIMGPWTHGTLEMAQAHSGDVALGCDAPLADYYGLVARWFDRWLKGLPTGVDDEPPIRVFVMGGGSGLKTEEGRLDHGGAWRWEREWPLARTRNQPYHLHGDGRLSPERPTTAPPSTYLFDPTNPVPTVGGNLSSGGEYLLAGGFDQSGLPWILGERDGLPLASRRDVLVFATSPLPVDVEVTGPITVTLWAASSAVDTDFTAKLIDWYPPNPDYPTGYALNLTDGIIRARYRNRRDRPELLTPGEVVKFEIRLYPTSNRFVTGHRIRLDISSSNFPRFDVNPNTGEPLGRHTHTVTALNRIFHDPARPSHLLLPIIPGV
jgi:putative CocE/NonD family hydrolase